MKQITDSDSEFALTNDTHTLDEVDTKKLSSYVDFCRASLTSPDKSDEEKDYIRGTIRGYDEVLSGKYTGPDSLIDRDALTTDAVEIVSKATPRLSDVDRGHIESLQSITRGAYLKPDPDYVEPAPSDKHVTDMPDEYLMQERLNKLDKALEGTAYSRFDRTSLKPSYENFLRGQVDGYLHILMNPYGDDWDNYITNSKDKIRKDITSCKSKEGKSEMEYARDMGKAKVLDGLLTGELLVEPKRLLRDDIVCGRLDELDMQVRNGEISNYDYGERQMLKRIYRHGTVSSIYGDGAISENSLPYQLKQKVMDELISNPYKDGKQPSPEEETKYEEMYSGAENICCAIMNGTATAYLADLPNRQVFDDILPHINYASAIKIDDITLDVDNMQDFNDALDDLSTFQESDLDELMQ